jgi:hypothetical protein
MWPPPVSTVPDTRQLEICTAGLPRKLVLATVGEMGVAMMCVASQRRRSRAGPPPRRGGGGGARARRAGRRGGGPRGASELVRGWPAYTANLYACILL